jgi:hypothetical protein
VVSCTTVPRRSIVTRSATSATSGSTWEEQDAGAGVADLPDDGGRLALDERVQAAGRLVEDQQGRAVHDRLDQPDLAPVARAELADPPLPLDAEALAQLVEPRVVDPAAERPVPVQERVDRQLPVQSGVRREVAPPGPHRGVRHVAAEDCDAARGRPEVPHQGPDDRGLARTVGSEQADDLTGPDDEVDPGDRLDRPESLHQTSGLGSCRAGWRPHSAVRTARAGRTAAAR